MKRFLFLVVVSFLCHRERRAGGVVDVLFVWVHALATITSHVSYLYFEVCS